jgi:phosphoglycolate phosphatase
MVGDTSADIMTGKNGGAFATIGVTHGFGSRDSLEAAGADYIVDDLSAVLQVIKEL